MQRGAGQTSSDRQCGRYICPRIDRPLKIVEWEVNRQIRAAKLSLGICWQHRCESQEIGGWNLADNELVGDSRLAAGERLRDMWVTQGWWRHGRIPNVCGQSQKLCQGKQRKDRRPRIWNGANRSSNKLARARNISDAGTIRGIRGGDREGFIGSRWRI